MQSYPEFGEIYYASLKADGCVQGGTRPVIIAQNNIGNRHSPVVEVIPLSSRRKAEYMPTHPVIQASETSGLRVDSVVLAEQTRVINQTQLGTRLGRLTSKELSAVGEARRIQSPFFALT